LIGTGEGQRRRWGEGKKIGKNPVAAEVTQQERGSKLGQFLVKKKKQGKIEAGAVADIRREVDSWKTSPTATAKRHPESVVGS